MDQTPGNTTKPLRATGDETSDTLAQQGLPAADSAMDDCASAVAGATGAPPAQMGWRILRNSAAQSGGRMLIALLRLLMAAIIVRTLGKEMFGKYSLVLGIVTIGDWMVDFGTTDVFVREICRKSSQATALLRRLTATRLVQIPAAFAVVLAILVVLRYPPVMVVAGLVGASNVLFLAGALVYRVLFRATLTMEREIAAELVSVLIMVPLLALACAHERGLVALIACHTVSRAAFLGMCFLLGRATFQPSIKGVRWREITSSVKASTVIGITGFLAGTYEAVEIVMLSKLGTLSDVAYFSGAQKLVWPLVMILGSIAATFYPVIASYWPADRSKFEATCQRAVDSVLAVAGLAICSLVAGAPFFLGLLGSDLIPAAPALRLLAALCAAKVVSATLGPLLFIVHAQRTALKIVACALVFKVAIVALLAAQLGFMGAVYGAVAVELLFVIGPMLYRVRCLTGFRVRWAVPVKCVVVTATATTVAWLLVPGGGFVAALTAPVLYVPLVWLTGAVRVSDVRTLLSGRKQ